MANPAGAQPGSSPLLSSAAVSQLPAELLEILVCPKCKGDLVDEGASLRCDACLLRYRIDDGIPVMLIDEAEPVDPKPAADREHSAG